MFGKRLFPVLCLSMFAIMTACNKELTTTQMQHARMDTMMETRRANFTYMVDNALLHDMSIAEIHFVPHTRELSGTGIARLDRMAIMLDTYGGTVRYETDDTDEAFVQKRLDHVHEYLATVGCDMSRIEVKAMMSGGRGMTAVKAFAAEAKAAEAQDSGGFTTSGLVGPGT